MLELLPVWKAWHCLLRSQRCKAFEGALSQLAERAQTSCEDRSSTMLAFVCRGLQPIRSDAALISHNIPGAEDMQQEPEDVLLLDQTHDHEVAASEELEVQHSGGGACKLTEA